MKLTLRIEKIVVEIEGALPPVIPDGLPADVKKAAELWNNRATSKDIMAAFGITGAPDYGTTRISQYRKRYGKELFPYRAFHKNGATR